MDCWLECTVRWCRRWQVECVLYFSFSSSFDGIAVITNYGYGATLVSVALPSKWLVSRPLISATVREGSATGKVEVTTPHGTLKCDLPFRVMSSRGGKG
jgi:hypothetical protein